MASRKGKATAGIRPGGQAGARPPRAARPRAKQKGGAAEKRAADAAREAARHSKIRSDHAQEIAEDYVELIANLGQVRGEARTVEIAERLGVSHVTVTKTVRRLARAGLVTTEPYRSIFLTDAGREMAQRSAERHTLVVDFLRKLGVEGHVAEQDAEGIEHHVSEAMMEAIRRFVGRREGDQKGRENQSFRTRESEPPRQRAETHIRR